MNAMDRNFRPVLPDAIEAAEALLGAILTNSEAYWRVAGFLKPEHFTEKLHQKLYETMATMIAEGRAVNPITIKPYLPADQMVSADVSVFEYVIRLSSSAVTVVGAYDYGRAVIETWARRQIITRLEDAIELARHMPADMTPEKIIGEASGQLIKIAQEGNERAGSTKYGVLLPNAVSKVAKASTDAAARIPWFLPEIGEALGDIRRGNLIGLMSDSGGGKGQPLDAPILTPWGFKPMGDIKVGSVITAGDGTPTKVIGVYPLGMRDIFKVSFSDGTSTEVTDDHIWLAWQSGRNRIRDGAIQYADDMAKLYTTADLIERLAKGQRLRIPTVGPVRYIAGAAARYRSIPPYTLGALLGDGCFRGTSLTITTDDPEIAWHIEAETGCKLRRPGERKHHRTMTYGVPFSTGIKTALEREGLWGLTSEDKFIPPHYLLCDADDRWSLLQGILDTDGTVKRNGTAEFMTKSPRLAQDVATLARSLGAIVTLHEKATSYIKGGQRIDCGIGHRVMIKMAALSRAFGIARKQAKCGAPQSMGKLVVSIEKVRQAEAQCIRVDHPSSLYVTNDFIVTHNTSFSLQQCRHAASKGFRSAFFSIEITEEEAALQAAAQQSGISLGRIDAYTLNTKETSDLESEMVKAVDLPFYIVGFGECSLSDIRIKAEAMVKSQGLDLIMIDHAKMITLPNPKDIFSERVNALYRGLKALAKSLNVAIVILIQRNDEWKQRFRSQGAHTALRPVMGDAYGGGSIKQSLDVWFSLYRPEPLYRELIPIMPPERVREGEKTKKQVMIEKLEACRGKAWIINHKRRRGEPGRSPEIAFEPEFTMFKSPSAEPPPAFEGFEGF